MPWQLQTTSLFCCKSPQLPSGTGRSELMGFYIPWKVAAAVIAGGNLMTLIPGGQVRRPEVVFHYLRMGHFYLFLLSLFLPPKCTRNIHLHSHCCSHSSSAWVDLFVLFHPDGEGQGKSGGSPLELCLPNLSFWRRAGGGSRADMMLVYSIHSFIPIWDIRTVKLSRNLGVNGYINSNVMMNQSQLLREAVALALNKQRWSLVPVQNMRWEVAAGR